MAGRDKKRVLPIERRFVLRPAQLAGVLGLDRGTIYRWARLGALPPPIELKGMRIWRRKEIEDWLAAGCPPARDWTWQPARRFTLEQHVKRSIAELARLQGQARDAQNELADIERRISKGNQATEALDHQRRKLAVLDRR